MTLMKKTILAAVLGASAFGMSACASDGYYGHHRHYNRYERHHRDDHYRHRHDRYRHDDRYRRDDRRCYDRNHDGYCD